ncbi:glycosyltransferase [Peribacillus sp. NPDC097206]|uniref:glycosyltransferase n=1 Tax=unclassified Peribacillus TaxID=2675266 RepID=UPI003830D93C
MRIVINDIAASAGGALSILKNFYDSLLKTDLSKGNEWIFLLSDNYIEETDNIKVIVLDNIKKNWINRLKFDFYEGKKIISQLNPDVVFSLQNTIIYGLKVPQILYMHQSIPFQTTKNFSFFKSEERILAVYQKLIGFLIKDSVKKADTVIVQTKWIKEAVINITNINPEKIQNIFPSLNNMDQYNKNSIFCKNNFFYPANYSVYKNHKCIFDACSILKDSGVSKYNIELTINQKISEENISCLGQISFEEVSKRYSTSTLIFPSYIETVGLPLIEASYMGSIILVADCPYSREALAEYENAYFFNPFNPKELAELMEKVLTGEIKKKKILKKKMFVTDTWEEIIITLLNQRTTKI